MRNSFSIMITTAIIIALATINLGCTPSANNPQNVLKSNLSKTHEYESQNVVNYGNGVYYFNYTEADFGNALSSFIKDNPTLELSSIASNNVGVYGTTIGYFAYFKTK